MRIAIDATHARSQSGNNYFCETLKRLSQIDKKNQYFVFVSNENAEKLWLKQKNFVFLKQNFFGLPLVRFLWQQLVLPIMLMRKRIDVLYTAYDLMPLLSAKRCVIAPQNMYIYRFAEFRNSLYDWLRFSVLLLFSNASAKRAWRIICISGFVRGFLEKKGTEKEKLVVARLGLNKWKKKKARLQLPAKRYLLYVHGITQYANTERLLRAFKRIRKKQDVSLIIAGSIWDKGCFSKLKKFLYESGLEDSVFFVGEIPFEDMGELYGNADAFVFPSLVESFAKSLVEAMGVGLPVAASNAEPMREVCGNAAVFFNPLDENDIAEKILLVLNNKKTRERLRKQARENAKRFSWKKHASILLRTLEGK